MHNSRLILFGILLLVLCQPIPAKKNPRYLVDVPQLCVNGDQEPKQWPHDVPFTIDGLHIVTGSGVRMHVKCTCNAGFTGPLCNETAIPDADEETSFEITNSKEETEEEETDPQSEEYDPLIPVRRGPCVHGFIERGECQCYDGYKGYSCDAVKCSEYGEEVPGASFCKCQSHYAGRLCNACLNIMLTYPNCVEEIDSVEVANDKVNDIRNWITNHGIETVIIIVAGSALLIIGGLTICCLCSKFCCRKPKQQRKHFFYIVAGSRVIGNHVICSISQVFILDTTPTMRTIIMAFLIHMLAAPESENATRRRRELRLPTMIKCLNGKQNPQSWLSNVTIDKDGNGFTYYSFGGRLAKHITFTCDCNAGWTGRHCEIPECTSLALLSTSTPKQTVLCVHGTVEVLGGDCQCFKNWQGQGCNEPVCENDGIVKVDNTGCECALRFTGRFCEGCTDVLLEPPDCSEDVLETFVPPTPSPRVAPVVYKIVTTTSFLLWFLWSAALALPSAGLIVIVLIVLLRFRQRLRHPRRNRVIDSNDSPPGSRPQDSHDALPSYDGEPEKSSSSESSAPSFNQLV